MAIERFCRTCRHRSSRTEITFGTLIYCMVLRSASGDWDVPWTFEKKMPHPKHNKLNKVAQSVPSYRNHHIADIVPHAEYDSAMGEGGSSWGTGRRGAFQLSHTIFIISHLFKFDVRCEIWMGEAWREEPIKERMKKRNELQEMVRAMHHSACK